MLSRSQRIPEASLRRLHPDALDHPQQIERLLIAAQRAQVLVHRGLDESVDLEVARFDEIRPDAVTLRCENFDSHFGPQMFLNFELEQRPYFFATSALGSLREGRLDVAWPSAIYSSERRDRVRWKPVQFQDASRVEIDFGHGERVEGEVQDYSPGGMGILVREPLSAIETLAVRRDGDELAGAADLRDRALRVRFLDGQDAGDERRLFVRNHEPIASHGGWSRIGLARANGNAPKRIAVERRAQIFASVSSSRMARLAVKSQTSRTAEEPPEEKQVRVLRYRNARDEELVAILDSWGDTRGAPAILIPTGWGQTKEALLPLARTIVASFRAWNRPVSVLRFDGVRQRGESHNDPECRLPGREYRHFSFSQGVRDIEATLDFLEHSDEFQPASTILVTFSIASIAGRKAVALDARGRIGGWVSVVGSPDLQSAIRAISGGVDLAAGYEQGMRFGIQEMLGVAVDADLIGVDANEHRMVFLEDSRDDFSRIDVPITWFHGEYDAWMDLDRVRDVLSQGDPSRRQLVTIPTGHQLRTSHQALETFRAISSEIAGMLFDQKLEGEQPDPRDVRRRWLAEGRRRPTTRIDLRSFWGDYLLGRDRSLGIELLNQTSPYRTMMKRQIERLRLRDGDRVADLGSGTGAFVLELARQDRVPEALSIQEFDCVRDALRRARSRIADAALPGSTQTTFTQFDLNLRSAEHRIPAASASFDAVLASLVLSYVDDPALVLHEVFRMLRPGGRLVLSSLCRDADFSRLYTSCFLEAQVAGELQGLPESRGRDLGSLARSFLNDAAKILELEESGAFQMWDPDEFVDLVSSAGFVRIETERALGTPPQAVVLSAERP